MTPPYLEEKCRRTSFAPIEGLDVFRHKALSPWRQTHRTLAAATMRPVRRNWATAIHMYDIKYDMLTDRKVAPGPDNSQVPLNVVPIEMPKDCASFNRNYSTNNLSGDRARMWVDDLYMLASRSTYHTFNCILCPNGSPDLQETPCHHHMLQVGKSCSHWQQIISSRLNYK